MKCKTSTKRVASLLAITFLFAFVIRIAAQNPSTQHQMPGHMAGMSGPCPMMGGPQHEQMAKLMDQVNKSAAALEKESNPAALKKKVAEHAAIVKQLDTKFQQCAAACAGAVPPSRGPQK
ncbi:MAG: hypothetical protein HYX72_13240 [Acidobacteria bacterium]|nr:hypothetical protein [Acidobacteriota bacterium]